MNSSYGVIALKLEFWLSVIVFLGGGALLWHSPTLETQIFMVFSALVTFWFTRRQSESMQRQGQQQEQTKSDTLPQQTNQHTNQQGVNQ